MESKTTCLDLIDFHCNRKENQNSFSTEEKVIQVWNNMRTINREITPELFRKRHSLTPVLTPCPWRVCRCDGDVSCAVVRIEPLHERWDLVEACAELLNAQWQRSMGARIHSLRQSSHSYPVCLLLLKGERRSQDEKLIGHARLSRVLGSRSLFVESVVVCSMLRGKGYGRILMEAVERYAKGRGCTRLCLTTHDKQHFYAHLGFVLSKPVQSVGTLASFMPMEVLHKFCRSTEDEEDERKRDVKMFNNPAPSTPSILPPPPPPLLSCPPPPISAPPPPPSCPPSSWAPVSQTLEQTPYTDNRGMAIFWMHKDI